MRHLAAIALLAVAGAAPSLTAAETTTKILQQRTPDGSILLTDRPSAGARTERSWQVNVEDPVAARRRALDVKAEANLVSERIQRTIEHQRRADLEAERLRVARADLDRVDDRDSSYGDGVVLFAPSRLRGMQTHRHESHGHGGRRGSSAHRGPRPGAFKG